MWIKLMYLIAMLASFHSSGERLEARNYRWAMFWLAMGLFFLVNIFALTINLNIVNDVFNEIHNYIPK